MPKPSMARSPREQNWPYFLDGRDGIVSLPINNSDTNKYIRKVTLLCNGVSIKKKENRIAFWHKLIIWYGH